MFCLLLIAVCVPTALGGAGDTLEDLKVAFSNVRVSEQALHEDVIAKEGSLPTWIEGSLVRHACGAFGEIDDTTTMLNKIDHLFDCIYTSQSYAFHDGKATYSNQYHDTNQFKVWKKYDEDMSQSSIYYETVYNTQNITAMENELEDMVDPARPYSVSTVSWWTVGDQAIAFGEYINGASIDVHSDRYIEDFNINASLWHGWSALSMPAHEQTDETGMLWTVVALIKPNANNIFNQKRVIVKINPATKVQTIEGEYAYPDADFTKCSPGQLYPDSSARFKYLHAIQLTKDYIIIPETSYLQNPCALAMPNMTLGTYARSYTWETTVKSEVYLMHRTTKKITHTTIDAMFATHSLGAYQDNTSGHIMFDMMTYANADLYTKWVYRQNAVSNEDYPQDTTRIVRYTIDSNSNLVGVKSLVNPMNTTQAFEFGTINPSYHGKPYKYVYMIQNPYKRFGAAIKLNVDTGVVIRIEMPDGHFPTEPIFVPAPNATAEDDGVVIMGGINGRDKVGFVMVFNATNMDLLYHADAPKLTLFGIHSKFYPFTKGCSQVDCTPSAQSLSTRISAAQILSLFACFLLLL
jgi:carotenoid cleavage dioxygenase-like enzyme